MDRLAAEPDRVGRAPEQGRRRSAPHLDRGGSHPITGRRLHSDQKGSREALCRGARYHKVHDVLKVKAVDVERRSQTRYFIMGNPAQVARDREQRDDAIRHVEEDVGSYFGH